MTRGVGQISCDMMALLTKWNKIKLIIEPFQHSAWDSIKHILGEKQVFF